MMATSTGLRFVIRDLTSLARVHYVLLVVPYRSASPRERVRSELNSNGLWTVRDSAFKVEVRSASVSRPEFFAFPSGIRIVDPSVDVLGKEAHRIGNSNIDEFAVH